MGKRDGRDVALEAGTEGVMHEQDICVKGRTGEEPEREGERGRQSQWTGEVV